MRSIAFTIGALCAFGVSGALAENDGLRLARELDWRPAPAELPRGAEVAVLFGDPRAEGPFVVRLRAPAGYHIAAHKHPDLETVTVLSGVMRFGEGQKYDPAAERFLHAGDFVAATPGLAHWLTVNADAVVQVSGTGPWSVDYVDPRDRQQEKGAALH